MAKNGRIRGFVESVHSLILLGLGLVYFAFEIVDKFWKETDRPTLILLNMVAMLCLVLGLERFTTIELFRKRIASLREDVMDLATKHTDKIALLERRVSEAVGIRLIKGKTNVYDDAAKLACTATHFVRTLIWVPPSGPPAPTPSEFAHTIAGHLKRNSGVSYEVFLAVDMSKVDGRFWRVNDERLEIYKTYGVDVAQRVHIKVLPTSRPSGFDILVVDDKHVMLFLAPTPGTTEREMAIHFENQPEIAQEMERWLQKTTEGARPLSEMPR